MGLKRWAHGKQSLIVIFSDDARFSQLALKALEWYVLDRGLELNEEIIRLARVECDKYPSLTVKEFVEGIYNKKMNSSFRGGK